MKTMSLVAIALLLLTSGFSTPRAADCGFTSGRIFVDHVAGEGNVLKWFATVDEPPCVATFQIYAKCGMNGGWGLITDEPELTVIPPQEGADDTRTCYQWVHVGPPGCLGGWHYKIVLTCGEECHCTDTVWNCVIYSE